MDVRRDERILDRTDRLAVDPDPRFPMHAFQAAASPVCRAMIRELISR